MSISISDLRREGEGVIILQAVESGTVANTKTELDAGFLSDPAVICKQTNKIYIYIYKTKKTITFNIILLEMNCRISTWLTVSLVVLLSVAKESI